MAIVLEGEKNNNTDWGFILGILFVIGIIGSAVVYLFFVSPETVQQFTTPEQQQLSEFSKTKFNPGEVLGSPSFQNLKTVAPMIVPAGSDIGKVNPFLNN
jgi:hypothetical protein